MSSSNYIEKTILYFLAFSLLLHGLLFSVIVYLPREKKAARLEPIMVELQDLPPSRVTPAEEKKETRRAAEERRRVARETAPRGERERDSIAAPPKRAFPRAAQQPRSGGELAQRPAEKETAPAKEAPPGESLLKPKEQNLPDLSRLFPTAEKMAKLEDSYRKKYGPEVAEGETRFLNTDDIQFGSFLRRFETAVYGVWRYPQEAARLGIEGVTPVKITFNRKGEIENVEILQSSGSSILDAEVLRTLRLVGPLGSFPKGYDREKFNLIAFFRYGFARGMSRGVLH